MNPPDEAPSGVVATASSRRQAERVSHVRGADRPDHLSDRAGRRQSRDGRGDALNRRRCRLAGSGNARQRGRAKQSSATGARLKQPAIVGIR